MMTPGQVWVTRRLSEIIDLVEEAAGDINTEDYPNFEIWMMDVFDSALNRLSDESYRDENKFLDIYSSVLSSLEDIFKEQLHDFYLSNTDDELVNESFDRVLDMYQKIKSGEDLKPTEKAMMNAFKRFVDKGGNAEDFEYSDEEDYDVDEREGERFKWNRFGVPLVYTFSEETEEDGEIEYFGEITFNGDEFLGVIVTDKRGYLLDYDFYSVFNERVRLKDVLQEMNLDAEITNFFSEEIIPVLRK
jgi:hypothetical protein